MNSYANLKETDLSRAIASHIENWIYDMNQAVGVIYSNQPNDNTFDMIKIPDYDLCSITVYSAFSDLNDMNGEFYIPMLNNSGYAYVIATNYANKDDIDYSTVVNYIVQIFNKQTTMKDSFLMINNNKVDFSEVYDSVIYEDSEILVVDILPTLLNNIDDKYDLNFNYFNENDYSWLNTTQTQIKELLNNFYNN